MRENERGAARLLDQLGHREGLAGAGDAEQNLMFFAVQETAIEFGDRRLLIALGTIRDGELKRHSVSV